MLVMLVVAGGVALATTHCNANIATTCQRRQGGLCLGTPQVDNIYGTN